VPELVHHFLKGEGESFGGIAPKSEPCQLEALFDYAASGRAVLCTITVPDSPEPAAGLLHYHAKDLQLPLELLEGGLTQWQPDAADAPFAGHYRPAGVAWILRNLSVMIWRGGNNDATFNASCNGDVLTGTYRGATYRVDLERHQI
jgi:hypothetical protein